MYVYFPGVRMLIFFFHRWILFLRHALTAILSKEDQAQYANDRRKALLLRYFFNLNDSGLHGLYDLNLWDLAQPVWARATMLHPFFPQNLFLFRGIRTKRYCSGHWKCQVFLNLRMSRIKRKRVTVEKNLGILKWEAPSQPPGPVRGWVTIGENHRCRRF